MHPFRVVIRFGELITVNRLSYAKHMINIDSNQKKSVFYRVFVLFIDNFKFK